LAREGLRQDRRGSGWVSEAALSTDGPQPLPKLCENSSERQNTPKAFDNLARRSTPGKAMVYALKGFDNVVVERLIKRFQRRDK
jgi:hypothetical protein